MKKIEKSNLQIKNNLFFGGFKSLDESQILKVRGGKKGLNDSNGFCTNENDCTTTSNTGICQNSGNC